MQFDGGKRAFASDWPGLGKEVDRGDVLRRLLAAAEAKARYYRQAQRLLDRPDGRGWSQAQIERRAMKLTEADEEVAVLRELVGGLAPVEPVPLR